MLDVNVLISAILSRGGTPARLLVAWQAGAFELIVSPHLLSELGRALAYPKSTQLIPPAQADVYLTWLTRAAVLVDDPVGPPPRRSVDPGDDYLLGLASAQRAVLVSGDTDLTSLAPDLPVLTPTGFAARLGLTEA